MGMPRHTGGIPCRRPCSHGQRPADQRAAPLRASACTMAARRNTQTLQTPKQGPLFRRSLGGITCSCLLQLKPCRVKLLTAESLIELH